jgi:uncharacterized protein YjbJ (UPF0337 family)
MKIFPWLVAGVGVGIAAYIVSSQSSTQPTAQDESEYAAGRSRIWGAKQALAGTGTGLVGKLKGSWGSAIGDDSLADEGFADQMVGSVKKSAGEAAGVLGDTINDLNG